MIRLYLLGSPRLEGERAAERRRVLSEPRRTALLAYLALQARDGPQRRDTLLGVFWPESDTDHARGALRNALHFLRVSLGPGIIASHGSEEIQLEADAVWCDAIEFERLCDAGDFEAALRLYAGDLLTGFFISEAPAFEQWLDGERARLRQRAVAAARSLADEAEAAGASTLAALRLRQLLVLVPTDESVARRLMRVLADAGDRGAALHVFAELETRLDHEYGVEPKPETRRLAASIRTPTEGDDTAPAADGPAPRWSTPAPAAGDDAPAMAPAAPAPHTAGPAPVPHRLRRRGASIAVAALAVAAALAVPFLLGPDRGEAPSAYLVAVMPFDYRGAPEHAYLGEGLADLLAANLNGVGDLRAVDPRVVLSRVGATHPIHPDDARRAAAVWGAGLFVLGSVTEVAGELRITASLYSTGAQSAENDVVAEGRANDILGLIDRLTVGLIEGRGPTALGQAALRTTHSVEALKSFLHGEAALRRGDMHAALEHYRRATEIDSTFALAHYRLSSAAYHSSITHTPGAAAAAALRHAGRLVRADSLLVAAWYHHVAGSIALAHTFYEEALHTPASHVEAAFQLGELRFHWGAAIGVPPADAREPFRLVLAAEPRNVDAALHLARLAAREDRRAEVDSLIAHMDRVQPGGAWRLETDVLRAFLDGDAAAQARAVAAAGGLGDGILERMASLTYDLAAVERLVAERLTADRRPEEQARAQLFLAHLRIAQGRYRDALRGVEAATVLPAARRLEYRAMLATLPFVPVPQEELTELRDELIAFGDTPVHEGGALGAGRGIEFPHALWPGMFRPRRLYLLAALHVRLGDLEHAAAVTDSLARDAPTDGFAERYATLTRARIQEAAGRPAAALDALGPPEPPPLRTFENFVDHGRPYERWLRAELLRDSGRIAEAMRWFGTFPDPLARDLAFIAPSHLRRAEIHDAAGDDQQASVHYRRFIGLWENADPELQPVVDRARARLRALALR